MNKYKGESHELLRLRLGQTLKYFKINKKEWRNKYKIRHLV